MDADKVAAIHAWPPPRTMHVVRSFLGLTGYYHRFIQSYTAIATPLTKLLKEAFYWTPKAAMTFDALKSALTSAPVLQLPNSATRFTVNCDASSVGFGAVVRQGAGPIAFFSRVISPHHAKLAVYERELIGLVKAVRHWRPYLWTRSFIVPTNHYNLKYLLGQRLSTIPHHAWVSKLFGYQFTIKFKPGHQNTMADTLSRWDKDPMSIHALSISKFELMDQFH
jgi:hypothetical protein